MVVGGGMASSEVNKVGGDTAPGTHTMVAGIVFQLFSITIFLLCAADFVRRSIRLHLLQSPRPPIRILNPREPTPGSRPALDQIPQRTADIPLIRGHQLVDLIAGAVSLVRLAADPRARY